MAQLKAISLFTGVGGLDFGFEAAGIETAVAVEMNPAACRALSANRRWPVLGEDIHKLSANQIMEAGGLSPREADVLIGGPPCQPFSKSGYWVSGDAKRLDDPRATTLEAYLHVLEKTLPRAFLLENVHGLAYRGKDEGLDQIVRGIEQINARRGTSYSPSIAVLNAAEFGVPQHRQRVFIIGARDGTPFTFPTVTHGPNSGSDPFRTTWDALGDLPVLLNDPALKASGKWADLLPSIPEGENYLWHTNRGGGLPLFGWRTRYWNFLLKIAKDRPSWTIQAQPGSATGPFHWANRKLSSLELARLQTFPDRLNLPFSRNEVQRLIGNAVPSLLAEVLAREIRRQLLGGRRSSTLPKLLPPSRGPAPAQHPVVRVPKKFRALVGDHSDHPGEGLGNGARQRLIVAA
ncbi:cytosine methyltransferase [Bradyrhizobium pachyrhizi]|uniref:DNA cytosine methyltransferase n=1 Tax=Bradyrhizobium pachyrhizi TaxID=280333 RepID=UPI000704AACB|nr:DNA cytosine methyltransferase [Bradyrhizobium pachyrhizi]KRQ01366.1 cytosine methyltransferase [Bradyrhizobium pachyrhizi]